MRLIISLKAFSDKTLILLLFITLIISTLYFLIPENNSNPVTAEPTYPKKTDAQKLSCNAMYLKVAISIETMMQENIISSSIFSLIRGNLLVKSSDKRSAPEIINNPERICLKFNVSPSIIKEII